MKLGIISDIHLGEIKFRKQINGQNAWNAINKEIFKETIQKLLDLSCNAIIIPGDLFDTPNPDVSSIFTATGLKLPVPVFLSGGNHEFSLRNQSIGCHPFDLLPYENIIKSVNEPEVYTLEDPGHIPVVITMLPYKGLTPENYRKIYFGTLEDKTATFNVLMAHGYLGNDDSEYNIPNEIIQNYDLVVLGHIHNPSVVKTTHTIILTPGSIMPSQVYEEIPSYWTFDTVTQELIRYEINKAPKMNEFFIGNNINEFLQKKIEYIDMSNRYYDLYNIHYTGTVQDIDEFLYKRMYDKCMNISLSTVEQKFGEQDIQKVDEFWSFVRQSYPEWEDEFKQICIRR